jgi:hypothetical protein
VTKCPQKKLKLKSDKKLDLANLENSFLILTFLRGILSLRQVCFFEISFNSRFFDTLYDLFQEKNFHLSEEPILKYINTKTEKR